MKKTSDILPNWLQHPIQAATQNVTSGVLNGVENGASSIMGKIAPWLMLPVAYGLLNRPQQPAPPQGGNYGPAGYNNNPGWRAPITPQYFGQDKTAKSNVPSLVVGAVIGNKATKKDDIIETTVPAHIVAENQKTEKLLQHPAVKQYVDSLINNP